MKKGDILGYTAKHKIQPELDAIFINAKWCTILPPAFFYDLKFIAAWRVKEIKQVNKK